MTIEINGKEYELYFGLDFIDGLNQLYGFESNGVKMQLGGLKMLEAAMSMKDIVAIRKIIKAATETLKSKPSNRDIDKYIETRVIEEGLDKIYAEFETEIKKQPFLNALTKNQVENQE